MKPIDEWYEDVTKDMLLELSRNYPYEFMDMIQGRNKDDLHVINVHQFLMKKYEEAHNSRCVFLNEVLTR